MTNIKKQFRALAMIVLFIAGMAALMAPERAGAQVAPTTWSTITNLPTQVLGAMTTNLNTGIIEVRKGRGLAVSPYFACTNASGSNVVLNFQVSIDGTNYTTLSGLSYTLPNSGTTAVRGFTNFPATVLDNVRFVRVGTIQNVHLSTLFVSNVMWSVSN